MPNNVMSQPFLSEPLDPDTTREHNASTDFELSTACRSEANRSTPFLSALEANSVNWLDHSPTASLPIIPGYEVEAVLGVGGMGVVFRARHIRLNRLVALKMVLAGAYAGPHERERFQREAEAVAALRHPNIVQIYEVGEADGRPYFTMEFVDAGSLHDTLKGTPLAAHEAAKLVVTLAKAIHAAHRVGIIHRDLKPANVLQSACGMLKVSDFGLARRLDHDAGMTLIGTIVGTPSYMAPEQARGTADAIGPTADVYSLGAILYELLTGRPPFQAATGAETIHQLLSREPVPPSRMNAQVPRDLETICLTCLHKETESRYQSAAALAADLRRFLSGDGIAARPEWLPARLVRRVRRRPALTAALVVAAVSTLGLVGSGMWTQAEHAATERAVDEDLKQANAALSQSAWPEARASLERAKGRLGNRGTAELNHRLDQSIRDLQLGGRLDEIRVNSARSLAGLGNGRCDEEYEAEFRRGGLGQPVDDPHIVAERVQESGISNSLLDALDHWSSIVEEPRKSWLLEVARRADRNPTIWRLHARDSMIRADFTAFSRLIETAPVRELPVSLLLALDKHLSPRSEERKAFVKRVQQAHRGDVWANMTLGNVLTLNGEHAEAIRYYQAAVSVRPQLALAYHHLGFALFVTGRTEDAIDSFRQAVDLDPTAAPTVRMLNFLLARSGRN